MTTACGTQGTAQSDLLQSLSAGSAEDRWLAEGRKEAPGTGLHRSQRVEWIAGYTFNGKACNDRVVIAVNVSPIPRRHPEKIVCDHI